MLIYKSSMPGDQLRISFCTVCMNLLHHLKETLPQNLIDSENYEHLEFVLRDYNSDDGLVDYIKKNFSTYLLTGRLLYFRTLSPQNLNRSHSRNLAFQSLKHPNWGRFLKSSHP